MKDNLILKLSVFKQIWGGEYRTLVPFLLKLGIQFRHPCPHTHQQNGRAERKHLHIVETGLSLLAQASLPFKFWWDAFVTSVFIINRLPTPILQNSSPFQCLFGRAPDYKFLKVFGCACFPYLRPYNSHKFQYRSTKCVFLGYSPFHKGYRCLCPSGRVYIARTVSFNEKEFPYSELFSNSTTFKSFQTIVLSLSPLELTGSSVCE